jgi:chaperonin GroES
MELQATNDFVFIKRDEIESETAGLILPDSGKVKPHKGVIISIGDLVADKKIKSAKGKRAMFHQTVGFTIEHEGEDYLVLAGREIIAIL